MARKKTIERWVADLFPSPFHTHLANERDKRDDRKKGAHIAEMRSAEKPPETDWRALARKEAPADEV